MTKGNEPMDLAAVTANIEIQDAGEDEPVRGRRRRETMYDQGLLESYRHLKETGRLFWKQTDVDDVDVKLRMGRVVPAAEAVDLEIRQAAKSLGAIPGGGVDPDDRDRTLATVNKAPSPVKGKIRVKFAVKLKE